MAETTKPGAGDAGLRDCVLLGGWNTPENSPNPFEAQARRIADRFGLPLPHAGVIARLHFGECRA